MVPCESFFHFLAKVRTFLAAQEMTLEGRYVRTIGSGIINSPVVGIAATTDMVAVGVERSASRPQLFMFDLVSGDLIRSFGEHGGSAGQLSGCYGLQFTRDGAHLLVAESDNHRLSLFTSAGAFVRSRSAWANEPSSVVIASNGAVLVPCASVHRVCVIPLEMSPLHPPPTVRRRVFPAPFNFGSEGDGTGQFNRPTALAMHGGQVYVLDAHSARVQVFN